MKRTLFSLLLSAVVAVVFSPLHAVTSHAQISITDKLDALGAYPCPDSDFTCIKLTVPLDHFSTTDIRTLDVVFGILPATGERKGMFVTATGGPGSSGLASADSYTEAFDPSIPEHFDIVFFDQRGAYLSGNLQCPNAVTVYYSSDSASTTPEEEAHLINTARTFAQDCVAEMGVAPDTLAYYGTNQAVADLEAFRQAMDDEKIWLYGESYGTQFAQQYTQAYPDRVAGLILDGTVDLTRPVTEYYAEQTRAFQHVLQQTLAACNEDDRCKEEFPDSDAVAFYNTLVAEITSMPSVLEFPLSNGNTLIRQIGLSELQTVIASLAYSEGDRMMLQRAFASAAQGDLVPLMREFYVALAIDPLTEEAIPGSTDEYSDALYYAVECNDYAIPGDTPEAKAEHYLRAGDITEREIPDLAAIFYGDLPCAFWPGKPAANRPTPLVATGIPTFVLGATADPATPIENGRRVYRNLDDGYLITMEGGPHVIFGRGNACPDDLVTAFLVEGDVPQDRETTCEGYVSDPYVPVAPVSAEAFTDVLEALDSAYDEIYYLPEYYYGDSSDQIDVGCTYGGSLTVEPIDDEDQQVITLNSCAFSSGFVMTGSGVYADGAITLDLEVTGLSSGQLHYEQDAEYTSMVTGEYNGEPIKLVSQ